MVSEPAVAVLLRSRTSESSRLFCLSSNRSTSGSIDRWKARSSFAIWPAVLVVFTSAAETWLVSSLKPGSVAMVGLADLTTKAMAHRIQ